MDPDDHVMHDGTGGRLNFVTLHPFIFGKFGFNADGLVGHHAVGLNRDGLGKLEDGVRRADQPVGGKGAGQGRVGGVADRFVPREPREEVSFVSGSERTIVAPVDRLAGGGRGGEPRWHGTAVDLLAHHAGVGAHVLIRREAEGGDPAVPVALETVVLHEARDPVVVSEVALRSGSGRRRSWPGERDELEIKGATGRVRRRDERAFSSEQSGQGIAHVGVTRRVEAVADAVLVVEGAAINQRARGIEDEDFGRGFRIEGGGE